MPPSSLPDAPENPSPKFPPNVELDPYYLWTGLEPEDSLPYTYVRDGLAFYIAHQIRWLWDQQTDVKIDWYLNREAGLRVYSKYEANMRLTALPRENYTAAQFRELHFSEALRKSGEKALQDPDWQDLIQHKCLIGDLKFLTNIPLIIGKQGVWQHGPLRLFCVFWDRLEPPFQYWSYPAATAYLNESLRKLNQSPNTTEAMWREWAWRLKLKRSHPAIVTRYDVRKGEIGFNMRAVVIHKVPVPKL
jgi:hypothetical protein